MTKDCGGTSSRASGLVRYLIFDLSFDLGTVRRHVGRCECNSSASTCPCPSPSGMHTSTTHASDPRSLRAKKRAAGPAERPSPPLCVRPFSAFARGSPRAARNVDVLGAADGTVGGILRESMLLSEPFLRRPFCASLALPALLLPTRRGYSACHRSAPPWTPQLRVRGIGFCCCVSAGCVSGCRGEGCRSARGTTGLWRCLAGARGISPCMGLEEEFQAERGTVSMPRHCRTPGHSSRTLSSFDYCQRRSPTSGSRE